MTAAKRMLTALEAAFTPVELDRALTGWEPWARLKQDLPDREAGSGRWLSEVVGRLEREGADARLYARLIAARPVRREAFTELAKDAGVTPEALAAEEEVIRAEGGQAAGAALEPSGWPQRLWAWALSSPEKAVPALLAVGLAWVQATGLLSERAALKMLDLPPDAGTRPMVDLGQEGAVGLLNLGVGALASLGTWGAYRWVGALAVGNLALALGTWALAGRGRGVWAGVVLLPWTALLTTLVVFPGAVQARGACQEPDSALLWWFHACEWLGNGREDLRLPVAGLVTGAGLGVALWGVRCVTLAWHAPPGPRGPLALALVGLLGWATLSVSWANAYLRPGLSYLTVPADALLRLEPAMSDPPPPGCGAWLIAEGPPALVYLNASCSPGAQQPRLIRVDTPPTTTHLSIVSPVWAAGPASEPTP